MKKVSATDLERQIFKKEGIRVVIRVPKMKNSTNIYLNVRLREIRV